MKYILIAFALFILQSCSSYRYDVTYEKCNGSTGSVSYIAPYMEDYPPHLFNEKNRYPELSFQNKSILNVCNFSYTKSAITK
jgi:hypothetical protein